MMEMIEANWLLILLALVIGIAIAWYVFHASRKTKVTGDRRDVLDEGAARASRNQSLIDAPGETAPQPAPPVVPAATPAGIAGAGEAISAAVERQQAVSPENDGDDLTRLKGVGPKLAAQLRELGITTYAEIAGWNEADIDRVDAQLGRFQGRIRRDGWVEQASYLAKGDDAGFAARYGNLS